MSLNKIYIGTIRVHSQKYLEYRKNHLANVSNKNSLISDTSSTFSSVDIKNKYFLIRNIKINQF